jgi:hypoxanthine phosphoribosyltransferase
MNRKAKPRSRKGSAPRPRKTASADGFEVVLTEKQIQKRVRELAAQINRDYEGKTLHVVGVLENCFLFMADLVRGLTVPTVCHFVKAEIHDRAQGGTAVREIMYTPRVEAAGKHLLLVEGILQSGVTLDHLYRYLLGQNPASLRTATLIEKTDERKVDVPTDYVGFQIARKFLVGYGLDYHGKCRNLPYVATPA